MNRLAPTLLAGIFLAASAGLALAATPATPAQPASPAPAAATPHKAHPRAMAAAQRLAKDPAAEQRMTHALNLLEAKGYGGFSNFKQDGKNFAATVSQDGQSFGVVVDPDSNQVTRQS